MSGSGLPLRAAAVVVAALSLPVIASGVIPSGQLATADRIKEPGWWPTKGTAPLAEYVGAAACRECHLGQSASQPSTSMARTAARADRSDVFRASPRLTFTSSGFAYSIASDGARLLYRVAKNGEASSAPLTWAFGDGKVGQSYLFERDGAFYEARVSYFRSADALDFTPGRAPVAPSGIDDAMGRRLDDAELRRCFGCHTTAPTTGGKFDSASAVPGVTCEACHGPGRRHAEVMKQPRSVTGTAPMLNPANLRPEASVDFCGACHAAFWDVELASTTGIAAMRSQPYRLLTSRCWSKEDARLTCTACHDPHRPLESGPRAYDDRCLSCHVAAGAEPSGEHAGRACPVGTAGCPGCHMPKYDVPQMKHRFTDHRIRVVERSRP
jgi:cytochrome c554/c'-like protein